MDFDETQELFGLVNTNSRLPRLIQSCCRDLKNNGAFIIDDNHNNIDFNFGDLEFRMHGLIRSFRRLEGVFAAVQTKEYDDLQSFLQQANKEENEMKCRENSINILEKLTRFLHGCSEEMERSKGEIAGLRASKRRRVCRDKDNYATGLRASKRRRVCRDKDNYAVDGTANVKIRHVESMILHKVLSILGW